MTSEEHQRLNSRRNAVRLGLERLNAITDGVLGFAMTLLVLNVDVPVKHDFSQHSLFTFFASLEHDLVIYAASFFLIARYWVEHHLIFHCIRYVSRVMVWLNFVFLFFVTMLPFATKLKGYFEHDAEVAAMFGAVHVACWISLWGVWRYAVSRPDLMQPSLSPDVLRGIDRRLIVGPIVILGAIAISFINIRAGNLAFLLVPICYLFQPRVDLHLGSGDELGNA